MNEMDMCHLMIDLETLGTQSSSVIMSIGAVQFDLRGNTKEVLYKKISIQSCLDAGLQVDGSTIEWWLAQDSKNTQKLMEGERYKLETVIDELSYFSMDQNQNSWYVWSHGSIFDIVLLENAYKAVGRKTWWDYRNVRDTRTLFDVVNYRYKASGAHDALEDAMNQAKAVQEAYQLLKGGN